MVSYSCSQFVRCTEPAKGARFEQLYHLKTFITKLNYTADGALEAHKQLRTDPSAATAPSLFIWNKRRRVGHVALVV